MPIQVQEENLKAIFGLKLRQYREAKGFSTQHLAKKAGVSASYINEIEKGKKYPKVDKIVALAGALGVEYEEMVSLKLGKQLGQLSDLLKSNALHEIPLELFGIKISDLIGMMGDDPARFSALMHALFEVARNYDVRIEHLLLASLRSYQELNDNYMGDIEEQVQQFLSDQNWNNHPAIPYRELKKLLETAYEYEVMESSFDEQPQLRAFRSVLVPGSPPKLYVNEGLKDTQKAFVMSRELGYQKLNLEERALSSSWINIESFDQVFNNFKASYFSGAVMLNSVLLVEKLNDFFSKEQWEPESLQSILDYFSTTPETLIHRLTQILPHHFGLDQLFFLRFHNPSGTQQFKLTKELHLSQLHNPHRINRNEHYCRRWVTITILQDLAEQLREGTYRTPVIDIQKSRFHGTENEYLCISMARPLAISEGKNSCITLGLLIDDKLKKAVNFLDDPNIPSRIVNESCERCGIQDCRERVAEPKIYESKKQEQSLENELQKFLQTHSSES
jgi:transcriptional regulator with XRE-family HTH domain